MGFAELELVPASGRVDLGGVEAWLRATPFAFADPHDPHCWFLCADEGSRNARSVARAADPSRRPYALLVLLDPGRIWMVGEFADAEELRLARRLVLWLLSSQEWTARDAAYAGPWRDPLLFFAGLGDEPVPVPTPA